MIGLDISSSSVKLVELGESASGEYVLERFGAESFEKGWIADGQIEKFDEVADAVEAMVTRTRVIAVLDTLDNLKKGGRIGGAAHLLGSMLSIKPLINITGGTVEEASKQRTRKKALIWLRDQLYSEQGVTYLSVYDGEAPDVGEFLDLIADRFPADTIQTGRIGAVIGAHGGPRVLGICYVVEDS